jgi:integrase
MGAYSTRALSDTEYKQIISLIRNGYSDHHPNPQIATILVLEANLGCRIGDIIKLQTDSFVCDGGIWKLNIVEEKTGKKRCFIVPKEVKAFIDKWIEVSNHSTGRLFTISSQAVWKALRQVTDYLGLKDVSSHSFRKYASQNLYERTGHDIMAVCQFLQHSSPDITARYIRRSSEQLENAISKSVSIV